MPFGPRQEPHRKQVEAAYMYDEGQMVLEGSSISGSCSMGQLGALDVSGANAHALLQGHHASLQAGHAAFLACSRGSLSAPRLLLHTAQDSDVVSWWNASTAVLHCKCLCCDVCLQVRKAGLVPILCQLVVRTTASCIAHVYCQPRMEYASWLGLQKKPFVAFILLAVFEEDHKRALAWSSSWLCWAVATARLPSDCCFWLVVGRLRVMSRLLTSAEQLKRAFSIGKGQRL